MENLQEEKVVYYEQIQANPMLRWFFFFDKGDYTAESEYFKEWQEYVRQEDMYRVYLLKPLKEGEEAREVIREAERLVAPTMAQWVFLKDGVFSDEYREFILQFIHDKKYLNILLYWKYGVDDDTDVDKLKKIIQLLVDKGANLNASFYSNSNLDMGSFETLLHRYCTFLSDSRQGKEKQLEIVQFLLDLGANPSIKDSSGKNVLHLAIDFEEQKLANMIIKSGKIKDINARVDKYKGATSYDETALNIAVDWLYSSTVKLLIEAGADVNVINHLGNTPLDKCGKQSATIEKYLRKAGAKTLLEILGSEEKVKEYKERVWEEDKIEFEKRDEHKRKLWKDYREISSNPNIPLAFLSCIEVEED